MNNKPIVISISAVSGGGKSTITNLLSEKLNKCKTLLFDDYSFDEELDVVDWVKKGADYNEWNLTPLCEDIKLLINDKSSSIRYIILDYPFSYLNSEIGKFINYSVFIDTPLDIALIRRVARDFSTSTLDDIKNEFNNYIEFGRPCYIEMLRSVKPSCDIVVDGTKPKGLIVKELYNSIKK